MSNNRILYSLKTSMAFPLLSLNYWACSGEEEVGRCPHIVRLTQPLLSRSATQSGDEEEENGQQAKTAVYC